MHVKHKEWLRRNVLFCTTLLLSLLTTLCQGSFIILSVAAQMLMANGRVRAVMYVTLSAFWRNLLILLAACKKCLSRLTPIFMTRLRLSLLLSRSIIFWSSFHNITHNCASRRQRITTLQFLWLVICAESSHLKAAHHATVVQKSIDLLERHVKYPWAPRHTATLSMQNRIKILRCHCLEYGSLRFYFWFA